MASVLQLVAIVGVLIAVCLIWGYEWSILVGSAAALVVGVALEQPRGSG